MSKNPQKFPPDFLSFSYLVRRHAGTILLVTCLLPSLACLFQELRPSLFGYEIVLSRGPEITLLADFGLEEQPKAILSSAVQIVSLIRSIRTEMKSHLDSELVEYEVRLDDDTSLWINMTLAGRDPNDVVHLENEIISRLNGLQEQERRDLEKEMSQYEQILPKNVISRFKRQISDTQFKEAHKVALPTPGNLGVGSLLFLAAIGACLGVFSAMLLEWKWKSKKST